MTPRGRGKPPRVLGQPSTALLRINCTLAEREEWHAMARRSGLSLAELVRRYLALLAHGSSMNNAAPEKTTVG